MSKIASECFVRHTGVLKQGEMYYCLGCSTPTPRTETEVIIHIVAVHYDEVENFYNSTEQFKEVLNIERVKNHWKSLLQWELLLRNGREDDAAPLFGMTNKRLAAVHRANQQNIPADKKALTVLKKTGRNLVKANFVEAIRKQRQVFKEIDEKAAGKQDLGEWF